MPSDLEQSRPQTSGEEELQLQLALAMSREENEKVREVLLVGFMYNLYLYRHVTHILSLC